LSVFNERHLTARATASLRPISIAINLAADVADYLAELMARATISGGLLSNGDEPLSWSPRSVFSLHAWTKRRLMFQEK
jgi:hypothetical protein